MNVIDVVTQGGSPRQPRPQGLLAFQEDPRHEVVFAFFRLPLGLSRLCSATFEQLLAFGGTFCGFSNLEQVLPFRAIFEQNIGLEHISSTKKSTISWKTSIHANFLKAYHVINLLNT